MQTPVFTEADENEFRLLGNKLTSTDKKVRDKTVNSLGRFISKKAEMTELELMKIWKGLYYSYWMSDKPAVQEELATSISKLMHTFDTSDRSMLFYNCFFKTMMREWGGIDRLRIDKYYNLMRQMQHHMFQYLNSCEWEEAVVDEYVQSLTEIILKSHVNGVRYHVADVYLQELSAVAGLQEDQTAVFHKLINPWINALGSVELKAEAESISRRMISLLATEAYKVKSDVPLFDSEADEEEVEEPKPMLSVDVRLIRDKLFDMASDPATLDSRRKLLYELHTSFEKLAKVAFPKAHTPRPPAGDKATPVATVAVVAKKDDGAMKKKKKKLVKREEPMVESVADEDEEMVTSAVKQIPKKTAPGSEPSIDKSSKKAKKKALTVTPATETLIDTVMASASDSTPTTSAGKQKSSKKRVVDEISPSTDEVMTADGDLDVKRRKDLLSGAKATKKAKDAIEAKPTAVTDSVEIAYDVNNLKMLNLFQLRAALQSNGLDPKSGKKSELVKRLYNHLSALPPNRITPVTSPVVESEAVESSSKKHTPKASDSGSSQKSVKFVLAANKAVDYRTSIKSLTKPRRSSDALKVPEKAIIKETHDVTTLAREQAASKAEKKKSVSERDVTPHPSKKGKKLSKQTAAQGGASATSGAAAAKEKKGRASAADFF